MATEIITDTWRFAGILPDDEPDQDFGDDGRENAVDEDELNEELEDDLSDDGATLDPEETETLHDGLSK